MGSLVVLTWASYAWVKQRQLDELHRTLDSRAELYAASIGGALNKYEFLPLAVAQSDAVAQLLEQPSADKVTQINAYLVDMNHRAGAFAVYVLDDKGTTLASSNWQDRSSYVGVNYGFRPYFKNAIAGGIGRFYGIGFSTFEAGYFISQPVQRDGRIIGIVAAKVNLDWIEQSWRTPGAGEQIWVKDANGVIILATTPAFKFKTLAPLSPDAKKDISEQRQFLQENLPILPHQRQRQFADGASVMTLERPQTGDTPALSGSADLPGREPRAGSAAMADHRAGRARPGERGGAQRGHRRRAGLGLAAAGPDVCAPAPAPHRRQAQCATNPGARL